MNKRIVVMLTAFALVSCSLIIFSCQTAPKERSIGFSTFLPKNPDAKWFLGTDPAIQVVRDLDKAWTARDYAAMRSFLADTAKFYFPDGSVSNSADEFITKIKTELGGTQVSWTSDYAFSVDMDPTTGGEHVQAGFTTTTAKDSVETKQALHEWYYIVGGKVITWTQFAANIKN